MFTCVSLLAASTTSVIYIELKWFLLQLQTDHPIIVLTLLQAVGNMNIAYKITIYIIFTQA
jgi:hypothetical protein